MPGRRRDGAMTERNAVEAVDDPVTVEMLVEDLCGLGVEAGETLLVHSSVSSLGWVAGGAQAVVEGLQAVVEPAGTLVVPTFTGQYSDPATWSNPPVPDDWVPDMPERLPPFRPAVTPTREMGELPGRRPEPAPGVLLRRVGRRRRSHRRRPRLRPRAGRGFAARRGVRPRRVGAPPRRRSRGR